MGRAVSAALWLAGLAIVALAIESPPARGYVQTLTTGGAPVGWRGGVHLNLAANPINRSGITPEEFRASAVRSLQRWWAASGGTVGFDLWMGTDPSIYIPDSQYDGLSSLYFASNATVDPHLSPNVLGLTQVWYDTNSGQILETDIVLNDRDFHFTTVPQDTSGFGSGGPSSRAGGQSRVFIENVLTHEIGHALGLSHSGGLQSTMLYMESPEQAHLGCDEQTAIRALYPATDAAARGGITGVVVSESGQKVFGAHVVAVSRRRGTVLATGLTDPSGRFRMSALEPGDYYLMVEPYFAGTTALPAYYAGMRDGICPEASNFARGFLMQPDGLEPQPVAVHPGANVEAPALVARCETAHAVGTTWSRSAPETPIAVHGGSFGAYEAFELLPGAGTIGTRSYLLQGLQGSLELHALGFSLYSPVRFTLSLLDPGGALVAESSDPVYSGDSGYVNFDTALRTQSLASGDYTLRVQSIPVETTHYPAGSVAINSVPFLLLTGSVNEGPPPLSQALPVNARCRMDETFPPYTSPPGNPPRNAVGGGGGGGGGFCSTIATTTQGRDRRHQTPPGAIAGWILPWALMLAMAQGARRLSAAVRRKGGRILSMKAT